MTNNTVFVVLEAIDLGDNIVSVHKSLFTANAAYEKLVDSYPYPDTHPELRYRIQPYEILD